MTEYGMRDIVYVIYIITYYIVYIMYGAINGIHGLLLCHQAENSFVCNKFHVFLYLTFLLK